MKQYDLGDVIIQELSREEIPAVEEMAETTLASTYDAYHSADDDPPEEDEDAGCSNQIPPQFHGSRGVAYGITANGEMIGGVFLSFDQFEPNKRTATLCLLGIKEERQGRGIGRRVWKKIEEIHEDVQVWRLHTPAFAIRNVAFYVNQCGFVLYEITKGEKRYDWHMFRLKKEMPSPDWHSAVLRPRSSSR